MLLAGGRLIEERNGKRALGAPTALRIEDGRIVELLPHPAPPRPGEEVVDAGDTLVVPGLINGHTHSQEMLQRGRYPKLPLEVWMPYMRPPRSIVQLSPEDLYVRTALSALEALHGGATTVLDDVNILPHLDERHADAVFRAYQDVGIRALVGISLVDLPFLRSVPFLEEEASPDLLAQLSAQAQPDAAAMLELAQELIRRHPPGGRVSFAAAPSAPHRCSDQFLCDLLALAADHDVPAVIHVHETRLQAVTAQLRYGKTMIAHLDDLGLLGPRLSVIHGVWLTPDDIGRLARAKATVQHNPVSNLRLASGLAPIRELRRAGVNVSLGTDGCSACVAASMLDAVRQTALLHTLRGDHPEEWIDVAEAWEMGTTAAAEPLGLRGQLGRIAPGCRADLACYRLDALPFTPLNDPLRQLVYAEHGRNLETVLVDGNVVMHAGRLTRVDQDALLAEARALHDRLEPDRRHSDQLAERVRPVYERVYRRALAHPIPQDTFAARL